MKKRIAKKITRNRLKQYLNLIDWDIRPHGTDSWRIYNQYGECTAFYFTSDDLKGEKEIYDLRLDSYKINETNYQMPFGKGHRYGNGGNLSFLLKHCYLETLDDGKGVDCISIVVRGKDKKSCPAYISFYNHKTN